MQRLLQYPDGHLGFSKEEPARAFVHGQPGGAPVAEQADTILVRDLISLLMSLFERLPTLGAQAQDRVRLGLLGGDPGSCGRAEEAASRGSLAQDTQSKLNVPHGVDKG
jgi:hypothetical protein